MACGLNCNVWKNSCLDSLLRCCKCSFTFSCEGPFGFKGYMVVYFGFNDLRTCRKVADLSKSGRKSMNFALSRRRPCPIFHFCPGLKKKEKKKANLSHRQVTYVCVYRYIHEGVVFLFQNFDFGGPIFRKVAKNQ